jgi:dipeptidyl aminopeptidase/acylaminoacyl peptidase
MKRHLVVTLATGAMAAAVTAPAGAHVSSAATTPPAGLIAYADNGDIWVMDADGRHRHDLSPAGGLDYAPSWSPDGSRIAFRSDRGGSGFDVFTMAADGSDVVEITNDASDDASPAWSPDGTHLIWSSNRTGNYDVWTALAADGSGATDLTATSASDDTEPAMSPDGSTIAFVSKRDDPHGSIYLMNADGTNVRRLLSTTGDSRPAWSPSGDRIAFESCGVGATCHAATWVVGRDGVGLAQVVRGEAERPTWSPDAAWLAVGGSPQAASRIYTSSLDGQCVTPLTGDGKASDPSWRPGAPPPAAPAGTLLPKVTVLTRTLAELKRGHLRVHVTKTVPSLVAVVVGIENRLAGGTFVDYLDATSPYDVNTTATKTVTLTARARKAIAKAKVVRLQIGFAGRSQSCRLVTGQSTLTLR